MGKRLSRHALLGGAMLALFGGIAAGDEQSPANGAWQNMRSHLYGTRDISESVAYENELRETRDRLQEQTDELMMLAQNLDLAGTTYAWAGWTGSWPPPCWASWPSS